MNYLSYRNLADLGFSEDHIKAIAAEHLVLDSHLPRPGQKRRG
jgi:hypothetical protein